MKRKTVFAVALVLASMCGWGASRPAAPFAKDERVTLLGDSISSLANYIPAGNKVYYNGNTYGVDGPAKMWWNSPATAGCFCCKRCCAPCLRPAPFLPHPENSQNARF